MAAMPMRTHYAHIDFNSRGAPIILGTTMKVVELVEVQRAYGWSPEELHFQFPHIPLGQIYAAFAYYWDHKAELDADIERRDRYAEEQRRKQGPSKVYLFTVRVKNLRQCRFGRFLSVSAWQSRLRAAM